MMSSLKRGLSIRRLSRGPGKPQYVDVAVQTEEYVDYEENSIYAAEFAHDRTPVLMMAAPLDFETLGEGIVTLLVGPEETCFVVHKTLLCNRVPGFFEHAFNGTIIDCKEQIMRLPNDDVEAFAILIDFVYRCVVPRTPRKPSSSEDILDWTKNMIAAYVLGSSLGLNHFMNRLIDEMLFCQFYHGTMTVGKLVHEVCEQTRETKLRLILALEVACVLTGRSENEEQEDRYIDAIKQESDLCGDIMRLQMRHLETCKQYLHSFPITGLPKCYFHIHEGDELCHWDMTEEQEEQLKDMFRFELAMRDITL